MSDFKDLQTKNDFEKLLNDKKNNNCKILFRLVSAANSRYFLCHRTNVAHGISEDLMVSDANETFDTIWVVRLVDNSFIKLMPPQNDNLSLATRESADHAGNFLCLMKDPDHIQEYANHWKYEFENQAITLKTKNAINLGIDQYISNLVGKPTLIGRPDYEDRIRWKIQYRIVTTA